jgi:nitroimidazol reductase NimA-like FMN-containing flavoprotein (pyridoxamine 5'-phosphate oxidase superfamily)
MIAQLSPNEIETLLYKQMVGRLGCHDKDVIYIVPISYAYDGKDIYCHSYEGKKMEIMRSNPNVCFQVDDMMDMGNWKSVLAWGNFEELTDTIQRNQALKFLLERRLPIVSSITTHLGEAWPFSYRDLNEIPGILFRICLKEKTGKFERASESSFTYA